MRLEALKGRKTGSAGLHLALHSGNSALLQEQREDMEVMDLGDWRYFNMISCSLQFPVQAAQGNLQLSGILVKDKL